LFQTDELCRTPINQVWCELVTTNSHPVPPAFSLTPLPPLPIVCLCFLVVCTPETAIRIAHVFEEENTIERGKLGVEKRVNKQVIAGILASLLLCAQ